MTVLLVQGPYFENHLLRQTVIHTMPASFPPLRFPLPKKKMNGLIMNDHNHSQQG
jgi:hypothetical protein